MILLIIMLFLLLIILQLRHSLPLSLLPLYIHHPTSHILLYCTWHSPSTFDHVDIHPLLVKFDCCVYHTWHSPSTFNLIDIRPLLFKFDCCVYLTWHSPSTSTSLISIPPLVKFDCCVYLVWHSSSITTTNILSVGHTSLHYTWPIFQPLWINNWLLSRV